MEEILRVFGSGVCWVDLEGLGNTGYGDFDGLALVRGESAVCEGGVEVVDDGERQALLCGCHADFDVLFTNNHDLRYDLITVRRSYARNVL